MFCRFLRKVTFYTCFPKIIDQSLVPSHLGLKLNLLLKRLRYGGLLLMMFCYLECDCYIMMTLTLLGCRRILDKGFFWDSTYCIHCYCLHCNNYSCNQQQKVRHNRDISNITVYPNSFSFFFFVNALIIFINYSEDDNRGRRGGRSYDSGFNFYFNPVDLFWWGGYLSLNVTLFKYSFNL